jgi:hypothetical protein
VAILDTMAQPDVLQYRSCPIERAGGDSLPMRTSTAGSLWTRLRWWSSRMCHHWRRTWYDLCHRYCLPRICPGVLYIAYLAKLWDRDGMVDRLYRSWLYRYRECSRCWLWKRCDIVQNHYRERSRRESRQAPGRRASDVRNHVERRTVSHQKTRMHLIMQYVHLERLVLHSQGERQGAAAVGQCLWVL